MQSRIFFLFYIIEMFVRLQPKLPGEVIESSSVEAMSVNIFNLRGYKERDVPTHFEEYTKTKCYDRN